MDLDAPWYGRFPADIVSEVLLPVGWRDRREVRVTLEAQSGAVSAPDFEKVLENAESLRLAGPEGPRTLPPRAPAPARVYPAVQPTPPPTPPGNPKPPQR